jgi:hypothetical protein
MNVFKIVGNSLLRLHLDNVWRPVNYLDTETLIRKIYEYRHNEQFRVYRRYVKFQEERLKISRCYYP